MTNSSPRLLIKNGTLIDGSGRHPVTNTLVVVEGNRIVHIGDAAGSVRPETPDDAVIDAAGKFIPARLDRCPSSHLAAPGRIARGEIHLERRILHLMGGTCDRPRIARRSYQHRRARR